MRIIDTTKTKKLKSRYYAITILNLLQLTLIYIFIKGYFIKYPKIHFEALGVQTYLTLLIILVLPTIFGVIGMKIVNQSRRFIITAMQLIFIVVLPLLSLLSGLILLMIPPVKSYTNAIENYLNVDKDIARYSNIYKNFIPEQIPPNAQNIQYTYEKYSDLFKTEGKISTSWILPEQSYEYYKEVILRKSKLRQVGINEYEVSLIGVNNSRELQFYIKYNNDEYKIKYVVIIPPM